MIKTHVLKYICDPIAGTYKVTITIEGEWDNSPNGTHPYFVKNKNNDVHFPELYRIVMRRDETNEKLPRL